MAEIVMKFAPMFVHHSWRHAHILLVGASATPGRRVVNRSGFPGGYSVWIRRPRLVPWCRGNHAAYCIGQVLSVEREDAGRAHRECQWLIAERVQHVNRIKGLLATQGVYEFRSLGCHRWERLKELCTGDGRDLPQRLRSEMKRMFQRLELVLEQVLAVEAERDAAVANPEIEYADAEKVTRLARLGSICTELATVLVREALDRLFATRKQMAACAGLTPGQYANGKRQRDQGIFKAGNALLRSL